jgi:hypothetical protein
MTPEDRSYFMLRAGQERQAARSAPNRIVRGRHEELAWLYEMRLQFSDRPDSREAVEIVTHTPVIHVAA